MSGIDEETRGSEASLLLARDVTRQMRLEAMRKDFVANASHESFYQAPGITFAAGKPLDPDGKEIYFAHWAGATALPSRGVFDPAWTAFSKAAWARFKP